MGQGSILEWAEQLLWVPTVPVPLGWHDKEGCFNGRISKVVPWS